MSQKSGRERKERHLRKRRSTVTLTDNGRGHPIVRRKRMQKCTCLSLKGMQVQVAVQVAGARRQRAAAHNTRQSRVFGVVVIGWDDRGDRNEAGPVWTHSGRQQQTTLRPGVCSMCTIRSKTTVRSQFRDNLLQQGGPLGSPRPLVSSLVSSLLAGQVRLRFP